MGVAHTLGKDIPTFWQAIKNGECSIGPITKFDTEGFDCKIASEIKDFDPAPFVDRKDARKMDDFSIYASYAGMQALADSGIKVGENQDADKIGVVLGNGIGGISSLEVAYEKLFLGGGVTRIPPLTIPKLIANEGAGNLSIASGAMGPSFALLTACSAGTDAIGAAAQWIRSGHMDVMITGGVEAAITKVGIGGFIVLQAVTSKFNDDPKRASRPFDKERSGFVMGEGAGMVILEEYEHAKARGAKIYAELVGYGMTCDANHLTSPHPEGLGAIKAMQTALREAGMKPEDIDYINAHGTSTPVNDPVETKAIKAVFGDHAYKLKVSSTKSMTGHCIGAAGGIEAIISILAMRDQFFPATINLDNPDTEAGCDLDYVPNKGVSGKINAVMSNTLGFGGHNGIVIFKKI